MRVRVLLLAAVGLAAVVLLAAMVVLQSARDQFYADGPLTEPVYFEIPRGAGAYRVAGLLQEQGMVQDSGLIPASLIFREGAKRTGREEKIRFGTFEIAAGASMDQILSVITDPTAASERFRVTLQAKNRNPVTRLEERPAGKESYNQIAVFGREDEIPQVYLDVVNQKNAVAYRVAVPEGLTSWQIVQALLTAEFLKGDPGDIPKEGTLAPDTYPVIRGADRSDLLALMESRQMEILEEEWEKISQDAPVNSPEETLILASIIEKETAQANERGLVSSVFANRLRIGMRLQSDPVVIYGITGGEAPLGRGLRQSELQRDTPFNTYLHSGLPPSPIANPGREAIRAALNPVESDYMYFVANGTGGHAFAKTYNEHRKNVRAWRRIEAESASSN